MEFRHLKSLVLFLALMLAIPQPARGRAINYSFSHIGSNDGLSSSCVKCIYKDSYGFMWFGTKNGLNRYDGHRITRYNCYDYDLARGNNNIGAVYEDADHKLWVGTDRGVYIYDPEYDKFSFLNVKSPDGVAPGDWVQEITADGQGCVWILIPNQGLFRYDGNGIRHHNVDERLRSGGDMPSSLIATSKGKIYVGTFSSGLYRFNPASDSFMRVGRNGLGFPELNGKNILPIREDSAGNLILSTQAGEIYHFDINTEQLTRLDFLKGKQVFVRSMACVDDEIWLGTHNGLYILNRVNGSETFLTEAIDNPSSLSNSTIYFMYADNEGDLWIGTMFGGVNYFQRHGLKFERYSHMTSEASLSSNRLRGVATDNRGRIVAGTEEAGYNILDPETGLVERHNDGRVALTARTYGDDTFVGFSRRGGLLMRDGKTTDHINNDISGYSYLVDSSGNRWYGSSEGLFLSYAGEKEFHRVPDFDQLWIFDIFQDSKGTIWFAVMGDGVWKYTPSTKTFKHYQYFENYSNGLRTNSVSEIMEDSRGNIWFSSDRGGLVRYNPAGDNFETFSLEEGLPDNVVYSVLEDPRGNLWFGTNSGLVKFNPDKCQCELFTVDDGLLGNQFNYHSATKGHDGYFYFGSMDGLIAFNPEADLRTDSVPPVYFTAMRVGNTDIVPGAEGSPLRKSMLFTDEITLPHDFTRLSIAVSSPIYKMRGAMKYSYRIQPGDSTWAPIDDNLINFANLAPGTYTLEVKADNGTVSAVRSLRIKVSVPWYASIWAVIGYVLILALIFLCWLMWYRREKERNLREREKLFKINKEKELYENKVAFFTELAHEIRTPLTLIDVPLQAIEELDVQDVRLKRYTETMRMNTRRLLNLSNQLLDFQKIGAQKFNISYEKVDMASMLNEMLERFEPAMALKGKTVTKDIPDKMLIAIIDREATTKIVSNMLNNALKYSDRQIHVALGCDADKVLIRVTSDGGKISKEDSLKIFEPFFQVDSKADNNGVGIGLPLCRTLAHLMHGSIVVQDDDSEFNTFVLTLPLRQEGVEIEPTAVETGPMTEYILKDELAQQNSETGYSILLVEDNDQMREFLYDQLSQNFVIETAVNGKDALDKTKEQRFDLILTDIMMPVMDGFELCTAIKDDIDRSHIPVVFLTAKNDIESKVNALKIGGEAFIEKPFSISYLRQQLLSLLENRRHERKAFLKQPLFTIDNMKMTASDKEFMDKVINQISENISSEDFNVEKMADVFCMSRSSLLRKIKTLFNLSPIELIRIVKLKKAAELIQEGKYRIGDIGFMVGITSPSYFSKLFFKQFGVSPKEFEKQCKAKAQSILESNHELDSRNLNAQK